MADPTASFVLTARDQTAAAINSASKALNSFGVTARNARNILAGFGVVLSARALGNYISSATEVNKLTSEQIQVIGQAKDAVKILNSEFQSLVATLASDLAPGFTKAVTALRNLMTPEGRLVGKLNIDLAEARSRIEELQEEIKSGDPGFFESLFGDRRTVARMNIELEAAQRNLQLLEQASARAKEALAKATSADSFGTVFLTQDEWVRLESFIYELNHPQITVGNGLEVFIDQVKTAADVTEKFRTATKKQSDELRDMQLLFDQGLIDSDTFSAFKFSIEPATGALDAFIERTKQAADITADMRTETEKNAESLRQAKELFDEGLIDQQTFKRFANSVNDDIQDVAVALGRGLHDSFVDFIVDGEMRFKDFLRRLAAEFAVSAVFKSLAASFGGPATFLGSLFGGFKAEGGPLNPGKWYVAGEHGPEPIWGGGPGAFAMGYGGGTSIVFGPTHVDARGADPSVISRLPAILAEHRKQTIAEVKNLKDRGRL